MYALSKLKQKQQKKPPQNQNQTNPKTSSENTSNLSEALSSSLCKTWHRCEKTEKIHFTSIMT